MRTSDIIRDMAYRLSPGQLYLSFRARSVTRDILATIDMEAFFALRKNARERSNTLNMLKYFNITEYLALQVKRALYLGIAEKRDPSILDIGTGFGYFPYVCTFLDGDVHAVDIPGHVLFDEMTNFFNIKKTHFRINALQPLPDFGQKFDIITGFQVAFNRYSAIKPWGAKEWDYFLKHLIDKHLNENGVIYLEPNYDYTVNNWYPDDVRDLLRTYNARVRAGRVLIRT